MEPVNNLKKQNKENIVLVGMSGCGKSTIGVLLAKALGYQFVDTDLVLQQKAGQLLPDLIDQVGNDIFLKLEEEMLLGLDSKRSIISTGGSVVYSPLGMAALKKHGRILYIHVPFKEIKRRIKSIAARGIVIAPGKTLQDVYNERLPLYEHYADITFQWQGESLEEAVQTVYDQIQK